MNAEKPRRTGSEICPLHRKSVKQVCHSCEWYIQIKGKNPQSEEILDHWGCAIAWLPLLLIENAQMSRQTGASVENFRNEMVKMNKPSPLRELLNGSN